MNPDLSTEIAATVKRDGYVFVAGAAMATLLRRDGLRDWDGFAASWNDLGPDTYMADGGRYRKRRHAAFAVDAGGIIRKPPQPHYQSRDYNPLNGGIARWFEPVSEAIGQHPALLAILRRCQSLFDELSDRAAPEPWHVEIHQFRIEARPGQNGRPTPEGAHRDGVDWALVLLVARQNVTSGQTVIYDLDKKPTGSFTLTAPLDSTFLDDHRLYHGVTPIEPADGAGFGYRDVLVVTFRHGTPVPGQA